MSEDTAGSTPKTEPKTEKTDQKTEAPGRSPYHLAMGFAAIAAVFVTAMTAAGFTIPKLFQPPEEQRWHSMGYTDDFPPPKANLSPGTATPDETFLQSLQFDGSSSDRGKTYLSPNVSVYSAPKPSVQKAPMLLKDLSDNAQARIVDYLTQQKGISADQLPSLLARPIVAQDGTPAHLDPYRADRLLIATVSKGLRESPGDRLLWTRVLIRPINFHFGSYTIAATDTRAVKIADVETTLSASTTSEPPTDSFFPSGGKSSQTLSNTEKVNSEINQQYESLGIDISPGFLRIIREGAAGGDVMGNTIVDLSLLTTPEEIGKGRDKSPLPTSKVNWSNLDAQFSLRVTSAQFSDGTKYLPLEKVALNVLPQVVLPHCALRAQVKFVYQIRHITSAAQHYIEGMQDVELTTGVVDGGTPEIVAADDISPAVWYIQTGAEGTSGGEGILSATTQGADFHPLRFSDYVTASELIHWLKVQDMSKNDNGITVNNLHIQYQPKDQLVVRKIDKDDCHQDAAPPG